MEEYLDFQPTLTERAQIKQRIETNAGIVQQEEELRQVTLNWWQEHQQGLIDLPKNKELMKLRAKFLQTFEAAVRPIGLLDRFKTMGVIASWWEDAYEVSADLKRLANLGFKGLIDSWVDTIRDALEDTESKQSGNKFDPLSHKIVPALVPQYLQQLEDAEADVVMLEQEKEAFEQGEEGEASEDGESVNFVKQLEEQLKELKYAIKDGQKRLKELQGTDRKKGSIKYEKKKGYDTTALEEELANLQSMVIPKEQEIAEIEVQLQPYKDILERLKEARKRVRELKGLLVKELEAASAALSEEKAQGLVLDLFKADLLMQLERYVSEHRQMVIAAVENWWDKYKVTLAEIEKEEQEVNLQLSELLRGLGYV
ncbi:Restriction endonuclease subunit S [Nostoc sp. DSM 114160]|jgi:DNA repair exonuclease SbcCD ATPase subunit